MTPIPPDAPAKAAPPPAPGPPSLRTLPRAALLKLTLQVAVIVAMLLGVLLTAGHRYWREVLREQIDARLSLVAESRRAFVREWVGRQQDRVDIIATRGVVRNYLEKHVAGVPEEPQRTQSQENLDAHVRARAVVGAVAARIVSREGGVLLSSDPAEAGRDLSGDPVFRAGLERAVVSVPRLVDGRYLVEAAAPSRLIDATRGTIGVVLLTLDATSLAEALRSTTGLGQTGEVQLGVREAGQIRFLFPPRYHKDVLTVPLAAVPAMAAATGGEEFIASTRGYRGVPVLAAVRPVGYGGWGLVAKMDEAEAYAPIARALRYGLGIGAVIALAGLAAAFGLARHGLTAGWDTARPGVDLGRVAQVSALAVLLTGLAVLAGWALKIELLKSWLPGLATMKPNTALCFVLAGAALALRHRRGLRLGCAVAIIALGGLSLAQDFTGTAFGTDQLLFRDASDPAHTIQPGRMSPVTAVSFLLLGSALLLLGTRRVALRRVLETLTVLAGVAAMLAMIGYAYGTEPLYRLPGFGSTALPTAAAFAALALGILSARADGFAGVVASPGLGGQIARRFLPLAIVAPLVLGWLVLMGGEAGLFTSPQKTTLFAATMVLVLAVLVWRNALALGASDAERTHAEESLRASEERYRALSMASNEVRYLMSPDWSELRQLLGGDFLADTAPANRNWLQEYIHPEDHPHVMATINEAIRTRSLFELEHRVLRADGTQGWTFSRALPIKDEKGEIVEWFGAASDITERKQAEEQIRQLNRDLEQRVAERVAELAAKTTLLTEQSAEAEKARHALEEKAAELALTSRYKSEFLANMSHELRTPLNSILIFSQQLAENKAANLTGRQVEFSLHIQSSGKDLLNLITDILDLSKIESGTVSVAVGEIAFDDVCKNIDRDFRHVAEAKDLPFHVSFARDLPPTMESDPKRLQQILKNLLSNAMKFTARGKVEVRVDVAAGGWSPGHPVLSQAAQVVAFAVQDTGIGIAPEKQRLIFEAFQQADAGTARSYGGTGLGLAISRELAGLLGGEIRLASAEGEGSTFTLYLPLHYAGPIGARSAPPEAFAPTALRVPHKEHIIEVVEQPDGIPSHPAPDAALRGRKVLVVDDDPRNIFALVSLLENQEMEVLAATNGRAAIEIIRQTPGLELVLMDIMMPGMDGYEAMREIRQAPEFRTLPILALSAKAMKGDREKCIEAGASDYIAKPVDTGQLLSLMKDWISR